jgi:regulatory protein
VHIELSDGSSFFVTEQFFESHSLAPGAEISETLRESIRLEAEKAAAWDKSLELLGRRDHSTFELERKLRSREFGAEAIRIVIRRLKDFGYLDDERYAEAWIRSRLKRRPEGRSRLMAGLAKRGIRRGIIQTVLDSVYGEEEAEDAIKRAAEKILRRGAIDDETLKRKLSTRGFTYRQIQAFLQYLK